MALTELDYSVYYDKIGGEGNPATHWIAKRYLRQMTRWLPSNKDASILEIGPGNGLTLTLLRKEGWNVQGIEADKTLAGRLSKSGLNVHWVPVDDTISWLRARPEAYRLIYAHHVLEHVQVDLQVAFVRAIADALEQGGYFVCETPNALSAAANWFRYGDWTHTSIFTSASLEFLLAQGGLISRYVGSTLGGRMPSFGQPIKAFIEHIISDAALAFSRIIQRIHLVAELRTDGLRAPLSPALLAVGEKQAIPERRPPI
ncbi:MAG TPA: class I SAM-dependent methyltransferase [Caulobacteraceae bacterium]|jgi:SAM-dependent methyltransferase